MHIFRDKHSNLTAQKILGFVGAFLAIIVFVYLINEAVDGLQQIAPYQIRLDWKLLVLSVLAQVSGVTVSVMLWRAIVTKHNVRLSFWTDFKIVTLSALGRKIPGMVWYALSRISLYKRYQQSARKISIALIYEIFVLSLAGLATVIIGILFGAFQSISPLLRTILPLALIALFLTMLRFFSEIAQVFSRFLIEPSQQDGTFETPLVSTLDMLVWILVGIVVITLGAVVAHSLFMSIEPIMDISFIFVLTVWGITVAIGPLAIMLPVVVGLRNGLIYLLLSLVLPPSTAALATLLWRVWLLLLEVLVGAISAISLTIDNIR